MHVIFPIWSRSVVFSAAVAVQRCLLCCKAKQGHPRRILLWRQVLWCQYWTLASRGEGNNRAVMFCGPVRDAEQLCFVRLWMEPTIHPPTHPSSSLLIVANPLRSNLFGSFANPLPPSIYCSTLFSIPASSLFVSNSVRGWVLIFQTVASLNWQLFGFVWCGWFNSCHDKSLNISPCSTEFPPFLD